MSDDPKAPAWLHLVAAIVGMLLGFFVIGALFGRDGGGGGGRGDDPKPPKPLDDDDDALAAKKAATRERVAKLRAASEAKKAKAKEAEPAAAPAGDG